MFKPKIQYRETPEVRVVDLRPDGVECIPALERLDYVKKGSGTAEHAHAQDLEFIHVRRGHGLSFYSRGCRWRLATDDVAFSRPGEPHYLCDYPKGLGTDVLLLRVPRRRMGILGLSPGESVWLVEELLGMPTPVFRANDRVAPLFRRLFALYDRPGQRGAPVRAVPLRATVLTLLLELLESARTPHSQSAEGQQVLDALLEEMRQEPARAYPVDELALRAHLSPTALLRQFRKLTGLPPHAYLLSLRVERAKVELRCGGRSVEAIARTLGYSTVQHFINHFHHATGCSPRQWRNQALPDASSANM